MKKKGIIIIIGCIVFGVSLMVILLLTKPWLTKEEKILNQIMGAYAREEFLGSYRELKSLEPKTRPHKYDTLVPYLWFYPDFFAEGVENENTSIYNYNENESTTYTLTEIDEEFYNTVDALTVSLKTFLVPDLDALNQYKDKYLLEIYRGNENMLIQPSRFFYLDGTLYSSYSVVKFKKIEDAEHPLSIKKGGFPKDSILNELDGKTYFCEYFDIYDPVYKESTVSFDQSLKEGENIYKSKHMAAFGSGKYIDHLDDIFYRSRKLKHYSITDNPDYEVVEIDEEFYNNGIPKQGFALHKMIDSVEELKSYKEKYAIIIHTKIFNYFYSDPGTQVYFYLDGKLYFSGFDTIFPMEEMKGEGITR